MEFPVEPDDTLLRGTLSAEPERGRNREADSDEARLADATRRGATRGLSPTEWPVGTCEDASGGSRGWVEEGGSRRGARGGARVAGVYAPCAADGCGVKCAKNTLDDLDLGGLVQRLGVKC